jgi:hypothetical protein
MKVRQISFKSAIIIFAVFEALVIVPIIIYSILYK